MKKYEMEEFKKFFKEKYYNVNEEDICIIEKRFPSCVYQFKDKWLYTANDELFALKTMQFQIGSNGKNYFFIRANRNICDEISDGDEFTIDDRLKKKKIDFISINLIKNNTEKSVLLPYPNINKKKGENKYIEIDEMNEYIKIDSFSDVNLRVIVDHISNKERIYMDFTSNAGGRINDMFSVLRLFVNGSITVEFIDANRNIKYKKIDNDKPLFTRLREINYCVSNETASSAEMFIRILRQIYPGIVYGEKTLGKLFIQDVVMVEDRIVAVPMYRFKHNIGKTELNVDDPIIPELSFLKLPNVVHDLMHK